MDDKLRSPTLTFFHFLNKNKRVSLHIYCYLKIESITTTIVSFNCGYMFHISLWLKLETVVKLFSTKLKHNMYLVLFIIDKGSLANETTTISNFSPSLFIFKEEKDLICLWHVTHYLKRKIKAFASVCMVSKFPKITLQTSRNLYQWKISN